MSCGSTCWRQGYNGVGGIARVGLGWIVFGGLEGWERSRVRLVLLFSLVVFFHDLFDQEGDAAFSLRGVADFGGWGEGA
jgi:hypothetical protein